MIKSLSILLPPAEESRRVQSNIKHTLRRRNPNRAHHRTGRRPLANVVLEVSLLTANTNTNIGSL